MHRRIVRRVWLLLLLWSLPRAPLVAQLAPAPLPLSNTEDARMLPRGTFRLRALTAWTRIDAVYGALGDSAHGARPLGTLFGAHDLGAREIPLLSQAEAALRTLTGNSSLALDVGRLVTTADSRIVITPLALEYGLSNRLTIGVMVPVVQTHSTVLVQLNPRALGIVPKSYKVAPFKGMTWINDAHYMVIPNGVAPEKVAVILDLMAYLLTPDAQAYTYDKGYFYPGPAVKNVTLSMAPKESQDALREFGRPEYDQWLKQFPHTQSLDAKAQVEAFWADAAKAG